MMKQEDWDNLSRLGELSLTTGLSKIGEDNYQTLMAQTEDVEEHPEEYNGPCLCKTCVSYAD